MLNGILTSLWRIGTVRILHFSSRKPSALEKVYLELRKAEDTLIWEYIVH